MKKSSKKYLKNLSLVLIPMFFASFVFAILVEKYKSDDSLNVQILSTYKELRETKNECFKLYNELVAAVASYSGSFIVQGEQLKNLANNTISQDHKAILFKAAHESQKELQDKKDKLIVQTSNCYSDFYSLYEELSLLTNELDKHDAILTERNEVMNSLELSIEKSKDMIKSISTKDILHFVSGDMLDNPYQYKEKFIAGFDELYKFNLNLSKVEGEKLKKEIETFAKFRKLFIEKIRDRTDRSVFSYLF